MTGSVDRERLNQQMYEVAALLGEDQKAALGQLRGILQRFGPERVAAWVERAKDLHATGEMTTTEGKPRTLGGIFFSLAKSEMSSADRRQLGLVHTTPPAKPMSWPERLTLYPILSDEKGTVPTVKITLIGRPGKTEQRGKGFVTVLQNDPPPANLSKDLPAPPTDPTHYLTFLPGKQFRKVLEALVANKDDRMIVEGWAAFDPKLGAMCVWAQRVTTVSLERAKRPEKEVPPPDS